jgi:formylglycine-generating enzyme required for sulfatase activity
MRRPLATCALLAGLAAAGPATAEDALCHGYSGVPAEAGRTAGMVWIPGGTFTMGDDDERPEERPSHPVTIRGFWIDRHEVTNAQFRRFVEATGYRTIAERRLDPADHPGTPAELLEPGSVVFQIPTSLTSLVDIRQWWRWVPGADWRHPTGPGSSIDGKDGHPVVHVAQADALAYARWIGRDLPTEAEWERAARGGLDGATYAWGDRYYDPLEGWRANTWQGAFPMRDAAEDGHHGTAPVGCYPPNGFGLVDMTGNVWEYTRDLWVPGHPAGPQTVPEGPPAELAARFADASGTRLVIKGGSWLCAPNFCARYRPAARQPQERDLGAGHLGFRTVLRTPS